MPENTVRIDRHMPGIWLDRLVTQKVTETLNAMLDTEAGELVRASRYERSGGRKTYRAPEPRHVPAWRHAGGSELVIVPWTAMTKSAQPFGHYRGYGRFLPMAHHIQRCTKRFAMVSITSARAVAARPARSCENHGVDATSMPMTRKSPIFTRLSVNAFSA